MHSHDAAAARAAGGTAGLYRLRWGALPSVEVSHATWFSKPAGMSYEALDENLSGLVQGLPAELWSRRMTLGPAPELCLLSASTVQLPDAYAAFHVVMEPLWGEAQSMLARGGSAEAMR